jgi:pimeloyl-ACP methyl ester carboxylesterase
MNMRRSTLRALAGGWACIATALAAAQDSQRSATSPPEDVSWTTRDGVEVRATYFPSAEGRKATTLVLLHDFNETRAAYQSLAAALQDPVRARLAGTQTRAVLTVDLRGHGQSKTALSPDGDAFELDASRFQAADFANMVEFDLEAVRDFLVRRNDRGELNLNQLCLAGVGMGANVAAAWAEKDWLTPNLPARKQAQDVKALVLVSPRWNYKGLSMAEPLRVPAIQSELAVFLAYGDQDAKVADDGRNIYKLLSKFRPEIPVEKMRERQTLFRYPLPTTLQGLELVNRSAFGVLERIDGFVAARLDRQSYPWFERLERSPRR